MFRISKLLAAYFSMCIVLIYTSLYFMWVQDGVLVNFPSLANLTLLLFFLGALFGQLEQVSPGETAQQTFFGKVTGEVWQDGLCFAPKFLPTLQNLGLPTGWGLLHQRSPSLVGEEKNINVDHFTDQRLPRYNVNVDTSLFWMHIDRHITNFFGWLFGFQKGPREFLYQRIGLRLVFIAFVIGMVSNITFLGNFFPPRWHEVGLTIGKQHYLEGSKELIENGNFVYEKRTGEDGTKYTFGKGVSSVSPIAFSVDGPGCFVAPLGRKVYILSTIPPTFAGNVSRKVETWKKDRVASAWKKIKIIFITKTHSSPLPLLSWEDVHENWSDLIGEEKVLLFETLPLGPRTVQMGFGMVCF